MHHQSLVTQNLYWTSARRFFVRNRVTISLLLFLALIVEDLIFQTKPKHGWLRQGSFQGYFGLGLVLFGVAMRSWAAGILRKGIDLTIVGPYSLCRNPLYLGSAAAMLGYSMIVGYAHDLLVVCGPIMAIYVFTVLNEERRLEAKYPDRWPDYVSRTSRFVPWKLANYEYGAWSVDQWAKSREYQGLFGILAGITALEVWRLYG